MAATFASTQRASLSLEGFVRPFVLLAALYIVASRVGIAAQAPLWLDETWSAMIATRPEWTDFWHEAWLDCNPPLYYVFLAFWVNIFGDSNLMLRLPSLIFVVLAASLPLAFKPKGLSRNATWIWAGLILLWPPGTLMMLDARGYAMLLFLSTASCLIFAKLLDELSIKLAIGWVVLGTAMFLTHYFAAILIAAQCLVLIWRYRTDLVRMWPASFFAVPGLAWFAFHLPRLQEYAREDVAWQQLTTAESAFGHLFYIFGALNPAFFALISLIIIYSAYLGVKKLATETDVIAPDDFHLIWVAITAIAGLLIAMGIGLFQASLIDRYLVPLVPPAMLGLALILQRGAKRDLTGIMLMSVFLLPFLNPSLTAKFAEMRSNYGYERSSSFVAEQSPEKIVFVWDHPAAKILEKTSLERVGSYFLRRERHNIPVRPLVLPAIADGNLALQNAIVGERTGIIWLYNTAEQTAARSYPPTLEQNPAWNCKMRETASGRALSLGALACVTKESAVD